MQKKIKTVFLIIVTALLVGPAIVFTEETASDTNEPTLVKAVMCEAIEKFSPVNEAVVFSIDLGRIYCFTEFDPVPAEGVIFHKWYRHGKLISEKQLVINPPRWSSFSSMQLRDADIGPWQVDLTDANGKIISTIRFSITD